MAVCIGATKNAMPLPVRSCDLRGAALAAVAACVVAPGGAVGDVAHLFERAAGSDLSRVESDVEELAGLARAHLEAVGLGQAMVDFAAPPWRRHANGLHLWGVTRSGMSWFDAGHPDVVGLDVSGMTDIEGRNWWQLAIGSAEGSGAATFKLLFPHPESGRAALGMHTCFPLEDRQRVLCAGAFQDPA
jgi:hypothetical protein